jgi:hypothetical protein
LTLDIVTGFAKNKISPTCFDLFSDRRSKKSQFSITSPFDRGLYSRNHVDAIIYQRTRKRKTHQKEIVFFSKIP